MIPLPHVNNELPEGIIKRMPIALYRRMAKSLCYHVDCIESVAFCLVWSCFLFPFTSLRASHLRMMIRRHGTPGWPLLGLIYP